MGMVTKKNLRDIIKKLIDHVHTADGHYKDNLVEKIISICSQDSYHCVSDFEWYITVLMTLTRLIGSGTKHGADAPIPSPADFYQLWFTPQAN